MDEPKIEMLSQPLLTEEGFVNEACVNELSAWVNNLPPTYERLKDDPEWNRPQWLFPKDITGYFANWAVRQGDHHPHPPNLEQLVGYLDACLRRRMDNGAFGEVVAGMFKASLCDINQALHEILMEEPVFVAWNTKECLGDDWLDLDALLHNVCLSIRAERRESDRFDAEFVIEP